MRSRRIAGGAWSTSQRDRGQWRQITGVGLWIGRLVRSKVIEVDVHERRSAVVLEAVLQRIGDHRRRSFVDPRIENSSRIGFSTVAEYLHPDAISIPTHLR